jgi:DNA repair photolyase
MYSNWNPPNRFDPVEVEWEEEPPPVDLEVIDDHGRTVLVHNDSPDLGFDWGLNPYRGCTHACAYCYARTYHEYLGFGAGIDFERKIVVKRDVAERLRAQLQARSWRGELVAMSGVTDCYQPLERRLGLTRGCLEVLAAFRNPVSVVTRSPLVARDVDLLQDLARLGAAAVTVSIPVGDRDLQRKLEPGAPAPEARIGAIRTLAAAGVPVGVSLSPILPGLSEAGIPSVLERARDAGASWAWAELVRLPGAVATVFEHRLREAVPERADGVVARIRRMRGGSLDDPRFGHRTRGRADDPGWRMVADLVRIWTERLGYGERWRAPDPSPFRRPSDAVPSAQGQLFA